MSIVKINEELQALQEVWDKLSVCAIEFALENVDLDTKLELKEFHQSTGHSVGSWDDIPQGECLVCGTDQNGYFSITGNRGGIVYSISDQLNFGLVWSDPTAGPSFYCYKVGKLKEVKDYVKAHWTKGGLDWDDSYSISPATLETIKKDGVKIRIQPGFAPFKITFQKA